MQYVRTQRRRCAATGALSLIVLTTLGALGTDAALAARPTASPMPVQLPATRLTFNQAIVLRGSLPSVDAGHRLELGFLPIGGRSWQALSATSVAADGHYRLFARLRRSGYVRVLDASGTSSLPEASIASLPAVQRAVVTAAVRVRFQHVNALGSGPLTIGGRLLPGLRGRVVWLQGSTGSDWRTLAVAKTRSAGRFVLRFTPPTGAAHVRVHFSGDPANAAASAPAGTVTAFQAAMASWYDDGGWTACGVHAFYGVANRSLPCGTRVRLRYGARTVTATVDDRGPFVGGRDWDLNQNTASALGFDGVDQIWYSY